MVLLPTIIMMVIIIITIIIIIITIGIIITYLQKLSSDHPMMTPLPRLLVRGKRWRGPRNYIERDRSWLPMCICMYVCMHACMRRHRGMSQCIYVITYLPSYIPPSWPWQYIVHITFLACLILQRQSWHQAVSRMCMHFIRVHTYTTYSTYIPLH